MCIAQYNEAQDEKWLVNQSQKQKNYFSLRRIAEWRSIAQPKQIY